MSRKRIAAAAVLLTVAAGLGYLYWPSPPPAVTWDRLLHAPPGGTRVEVYEAVGGPPGDYRQRGFVGTTPGVPAAFDTADAETWTVDQGEVHIWFGPDGRATNFLGSPSHDFRPTFNERVRYVMGI